MSKNTAAKSSRRRVHQLFTEAIPRESHRIAMAQWDHDGVEREHPDWEYAAEVNDSGTCGECQQAILWGVTIRGLRAPFDPAPPHRVHTVTCPVRTRRNNKREAVRLTNNR